MTNFSRPIKLLRRLASRTKRYLAKRIARETAPSKTIDGISDEIAKNFFIWDKCEIIIACPHTVFVAGHLFPGKPIVCCADKSNEIEAALNNQYLNVMGVVSPWLMQTLFKNSNAASLLLRACRRQLIYLQGSKSPSEPYDTRKLLHRVGFYQISTPTPPNSDDFISVGCTPEGNYLLFGSEPASSLDNHRWITQKAMRLGELDTKRLKWKNQLIPPFERTHSGFSTASGSLSLAVTEIQTPADTVTIKIQGTFSWESTRPNSGYASLIGCYSGPGDFNMYACLLQLTSEKIPLIALWINDGNWRQLAYSIIPDKHLSINSPFHSVTLWMKIGASAISIGCDESALLETINTEIKRTPLFGIRIYDQWIAISKVSCSVN